MVRDLTSHEEFTAHKEEAAEKNIFSRHFRIIRLETSFPFHWKYVALR